MKLHPDCKLTGGLFHFSCVVNIQLFEPLEDATDTGAGLPPAVGYYQTFGVTARSAADAVKILTGHLDRMAVPPGADGGIVEIDVAVVYPPSIELEFVEGDIEKRGVRSVTGRVFYPEDEESESDEDDSAGESLIH